jgi:outer membrane protein
MKQALTLGLVIIALTAFNPFLHAQNKTGYVSIDEVVQLMPDYKKATAEMSQYDSTLQIEYAETLKELNRQDSLFKMDSTKMSPAAKNAKKEMMKKLLVELQGYEQNYQQKMQQKQEELMAPIAQKANQLIADVAKASGYTYVFRKEALLVQPDTDDILPLIKKKLEGGTPKPPVK